MAIVIPSKHIYDKDNNKIRDNKIDKIEVGAVEIVPDNKFDTVIYNAKETTKIDSGHTFVSNETGYTCIPNWISPWEFEYGTAVAQATFTTYYNSIKLKIPKKTNKYSISKLLEKDDNGNSKIFANVYCTKKTGSVGVQSQILYSIDGSNTLDPIKVVSVVPAPPTDGDRTLSSGETVLLQTVPDDIQATENITVNTINYTATATAEKHGTKNMAFITEDDDYYNVDYYLLVGVIYDRVTWSEYGNIDANTTKQDKVKDILLEGTSEAYIPSYVEITFYGNTIGIDLNNKTVYIPDENGNKPFSIEGNELMQTSNYYTLKEFLLKQVSAYELITPTSYYVGKSNYNNHYYTSVHIGGKENSWETYVEYKDTKDNIIKTVIIPPRQNTHSPALETIGADTIEIIKVYNKNSICLQFQDTLLEYSNGKETATILCDIYNYDVGVKFKVLSYELLDDGSVYCRLKTDNINDIYDISNMGYIYVNGIEGFVRDIDEEEFILFVYFNDASVIDYLEKNEITINKKSNLFNIGDVVIPMVYGANGVDKPLSKYKDGTPKKFKVLGNRIFYDGAVWQELTLQETLE